MPDFVVQVDAQGRRSSAQRDGQPFDGDIHLAPLHKIVSFYFCLAESNLAAMHRQKDAGERRSHGLQCFLMSLIGLEAFTNTFFHMLGIELGIANIKGLIAERSPLHEKIRNLANEAGMKPLSAETSLFDRIRELSRQRNAIVHPKWSPNSLELGDSNGAIIGMDGLADDPNLQFENADYCASALCTCMLVIARIGQARGNADPTAFLFHWTGMFGVSVENLEVAAQLSR